MVSRDTEPELHHQFLLNVLVQQAGVALVNARLHTWEHAIADELRAANLALEHVNTVLTLELAHLQALGEAELRLRRDLVEELLAGTDAESAIEEITNPTPTQRRAFELIGVPIPLTLADT